MKQFARPFLSVLLLLSTGVAGAGCNSETRSERPCSETKSSHSNTGSGCNTASTTGSGCHTEVRSAGCHGCQETTFLGRPQGRDTAAFFFPYLYGADMGDQCFTGFVGFRYQQTFKGHRLAECLFGSDTLFFEGSQVPDRSTTALVADYFGLAPNFRGQVHFKPRIRNYNVDFAGRMELGPWMECLEGAYFELNATATHSKWDLRACETVLSATGGDQFDKFPANYMSKTQADTVSSLKSALSGKVTFGDLNDERRNGNIRFHSKSKTALANIDMILGYDFLLCDTYHLGAFIIGSAPTGNKPSTEYIFDPIIGNGHHWELGGGITAHYEFWNCDDQSMGLYLNGHVEHLFKDKQRRLFDFNNVKDGDNGCLSRYLLLKEFDTDNSYAGRLEYAANILAPRVESSFKVQGDASLRLLYRACGWAAGLGYNVYGRTRERLHLSSRCCSRDERNFGIKGTTGVAALNSENKTVPLVATQSTARITTVTEDVDNQASLPNSTSWNHSEEGAFDSLENGESAPILVSKANINLESGRIKSYLTHKVFAHVDYQWDDCECKPYLGVGGEVEFAHKGKERVCTANQWGVWVRTGVSF